MYTHLFSKALLKKEVAKDPKLDVTVRFTGASSGLYKFNVIKGSSDTPYQIAVNPNGTVTLKKPLMNRIFNATMPVNSCVLDSDGTFHDVRQGKSTDYSNVAHIGTESQKLCLDLMLSAKEACIRPSRGRVSL